MNVIEQIKELEGKLVYVNAQIELDYAPWEKNEYIQLKIGYAKKIARLRMYVKNHPEVFGLKID